MALTRRNWFLHRVAPTGALFAAAGSGAASAAPALAAGPGGKKATIEKTLALHPYLQVAAQYDLEKTMSIIVRKNKNGKGSVHNAEIAKAHGGTVKSDFDAFIGSFEMEVKAKHLPKLAKHPKVEYLSPTPKLKNSTIDTSQLCTTFNQTLNIPSIWNGTTPATGTGVTVCVLDSGVRENHADLTNVTPIVINPRATGRKDQNGHGTHVIGIIKGKNAQGRYIGVAPGCHVVSIQIADDTGASRECDLIRGLEWVNQNKTLYNIRVVNLSVNGSIPTSYLTSPICAAVETLWNRGVVVVVAAGNRGSALDAVRYAPACDPFALAVGALDNAQTAGLTDDCLATFSSRGLTLDGHAKPEVVAPGRMIVSTLAATNCTLGTQFPDRIVDSNYLRLSGTSMAAPVVAGVAALILERFPSLTSNQVKWLLMNTMKAYPGKVGAAGLIDPPAAMARAAQGNLGSANSNVAYNTTVADGMAQVLLNNSASYWDASYWDASYWDASYWDANAWEAATFESFPE